jgi:hypothetical protein
MLGGIENGLFFKSFAGFAVIAFFILVLRWAFSQGNSLIERPSKRGKADEYGLFVPVAAPKNFIEGDGAAEVASWRYQGQSHSNPRWSKGDGFQERFADRPSDPGFGRLKPILRLVKSS